MSLVERINRHAQRKVEEAQGVSRQSEPRDLTEQDVLGWADALDRREKAPIKPRTIQDVRALIRNRNPVRWNQMQRDFRWVQKQMKKAGLNPEDARYIL